MIAGMGLVVDKHFLKPLPRERAVSSSAGHEKNAVVRHHTHRTNEEVRVSREKPFGPNAFAIPFFCFVFGLFQYG